MTALILGLAIAVSPVAPPTADATAAGCSSRWPATIRVHLAHKRGSPVPARVVTMGFDDYVGSVMASGAAPATKPMAALRAMATVVAARAHWFVCHPQPGYSWHGRRYDIHSGTARSALRGADAGQYLRPGAYVHSRIRRAVAAVHGTLLRRPNGSMRKPQWSGRPGRCGAGIRGNRLPAQAASDCARRGMSWRAIIRLYIPKGRIVEPSR